MVFLTIEFGISSDERCAGLEQMRTFGDGHWWCGVDECYIVVIAFTRKEKRCYFQRRKEKEKGGEKQTRGWVKQGSLLLLLGQSEASEASTAHKECLKKGREV